MSGEEARRWIPRALLVASCLVPSNAAAHVPTYGVGTVSVIVFAEDRIRITFDLSYDGYWAQGEMILMDADRTQLIDEREADGYLEERWTRKIAPAVRAKLDGAEVPITVASRRHDGLVGEIFPSLFSLYYELEVRLPGGAGFLPGREYVFELEDIVTRDESPAKPRFTVPYLGQGAEGRLGFSPIEFGPAEARLEADAYVVEDRRLVVRFRMDRLGDDPAGPGSTDKTERPMAPHPEGSLPPEADAERSAGTRLTSSLEDAIQDPGALGWWGLLGCVVLATIAGAAHALAPGHGKAMVAAYLIGTRGRVRDAVTLGLVTTLTHTGSVFLFGITLFLVVSQSTRVSEAALQNRIIVLTQLVSGALLFVLGMGLFVRRARSLRRGASAHEHEHHHAHDHGHESHGHSHPPRLRDLLALGISGGLVPCPAGLTVILVGLHFPDKLLFAIFLLVFFSLGLGSVLVAIGVALITGKALVVANRLRAGEPEGGRASRWRRAGSRVLRWLPVASSLFIAGLGVLFCVTTVLTGRTELAALLRAAAQWLQPSS